MTLMMERLCEAAKSAKINGQRTRMSDAYAAEIVTSILTELRDLDEDTLAEAGIVGLFATGGAAERARAACVAAVDSILADTKNTTPGQPEAA